MRKWIAGLLLSALLFPLYAGTVRAVDDAAGLNYQLILRVTDTEGKEKNQFAIGETVYVTLQLRNTGGGTAPIYALQVDILFDDFVLKSQELEQKNGVQTSLRPGRIKLVYLDRSGQGVEESLLSELGRFSFQAQNDGPISFTLDRALITNQDVTTRQLDASSKLDLVVGTGTKNASKEALNAAIEAAQEELNRYTVTDESNPAIYAPDFWITTRTRDMAQAAINAAKAVLEKPDVTTGELEQAMADLSYATSILQQSKILGAYRWSSFVLVTAIAKEHGQIHPNSAHQRCRESTSCTITAIPEEGYEVEYVFVNGERFAGSNPFTISGVMHDTEAVFTFCKTPPFVDIKPTDWYYPAVRYVYQHALMNGISLVNFAPQDTMNRAMLATVLYRMADTPKTEGMQPFEDVQQESWYRDAVAWNYEKGIVKGYSATLFAPDAAVTREQIAVMLYRYVQSSGAETPRTGKLDLYADAQNISAFAIEAMEWAIGIGLIEGTPEHMLNPEKSATRAELATMLMRWREQEG